MRVARSVYRWAGDLTPRDLHLARVRAVLLRQGESVVVSHESAAVLHALPVATQNPPLVHVTVVPPARVRKRSGYHTHVAPLTAEEVVEVDGLPVTSLARTVADLARTSEFAWAVAAADQALRRGLSAESLMGIADAGPRLSGIGAVRRVALFADARSESVAESVSRVTMARAGIPAPELQFNVVGPHGWVARGDFGWPGLGVVGEMDGKAKYGELLRPGQRPEDVIMAEKRRDEAIRQAAWWPCHWGWQEAWDVRALGTLLRGAFAVAGRLRAS